MVDANSKSEWHLADLNLQVRQTKIAGAARDSLIAPSKLFEIYLTAKTFYLDDFLVDGDCPQPGVSDSALGDSAIPTDFLRDLIARLGIKVTKLRLNSMVEDLSSLRGLKNW